MPPKSAGAMLSGCPSISEAILRIDPESKGLPAIPLAASIPPRIRGTASQAPGYGNGAVKVDMKAVGDSAFPDT